MVSSPQCLIRLDACRVDVEERMNSRRVSRVLLFSAFGRGQSSNEEYSTNDMPFPDSAGGMMALPTRTLPRPIFANMRVI